MMQTYRITPEDQMPHSGCITRQVLNASCLGLTGVDGGEKGHASTNALEVADNDPRAGPVTDLRCA